MNTDDKDEKILNFGELGSLEIITTISVESDEDYVYEAFAI